jgi:archaea-specific RecJ-like exonuclease
MGKKFSKPMKKNIKRDDTPVKDALIKDVDSNSKKVQLIVEVSRIVQTGGPTVFVVSDGTASLSLKGFISPGERAFPDIEEGDCIKAIVNMGEFQGELEGDIVKTSKLSPKEKTEFLASLEAIELKRAHVDSPGFMVKGKIVEKLEKSFIEAAIQIRLAIIRGRPIIVRHHNDTDGYCSGYALEKAILPLILNQHGVAKSAWEFFTRAPCQAPFYEVDDSIRDTSNSLRNVAKFSNKMPLIIIADNGSSPQDLMGIKQGKIHGADFIVVDHHQFEEDVISEEVLVHINPFLVEENGSCFSAGMLCAELARFINEDVQNIKQLPAMAGYDDRIDLAAPETMEKYLSLAEEEGYDKKLLSDIAIVIDYVSAKVRFMEVREYIEVLFGEPREQQKKLVSLMAPYIRKMDAKGLSMGVSNAQQEKIGATTLQSIDIAKTFPGFGFFPKPGRSVSLIHDDYQKTSGEKAVVTAGIMATAITMRATDEADFSVQELIKMLDKKLPDAFVEGGGHKNAGSISFLPYKKDEVVALLKEFIKK